jgi:hypothetical protein
MQRQARSLRCCKVVSFLLLLSSGAAFADSYSFSLIPPSGNIQGAPGSTIGWGYSIANQSSSQWLETTLLNADLVQNATFDFSYFDLPILAPDTTVTVTFDTVAFTGLAALTWDASAPAGFTNSGNFYLSAQWLNGDPFGGGNFLAEADATAAYSATVSVATPEPSAVMTLATELILPLAFCLLFMRGVIPRRKRTGTP